MREEEGVSLEIERIKTMALKYDETPGTAASNSGEP